MSKDSPAISMQDIDKQSNIKVSYQHSGDEIFKSMEREKEEQIRQRVQTMASPRSREQNFYQSIFNDKKPKVAFKKPAHSPLIT